MAESSITVRWKQSGAARAILRRHPWLVVADPLTGLVIVYYGVLEAREALHHHPAVRPGWGRLTPGRGPWVRDGCVGWRGSSADSTALMRVAERVAGWNIDPHFQSTGLTVLSCIGKGSGEIIDRFQGVGVVIA